MDYQQPDYNYQNPYTTAKASLDRQTSLPSCFILAGRFQNNLFF